MGIMPAPETNNAVAAVVAEARCVKEEGRERTILLNRLFQIDFPIQGRYRVGKRVFEK